MTNFTGSTYELDKKVAELKQELVSKLNMNNKTEFEIKGVDSIRIKQTPLESFSIGLDSYMCDYSEEKIHQNYNLHFCVSSLFKAHFGFDYSLIEFGTPESKTVVYNRTFNLTMVDKNSKEEFDVKLYIGKVEFKKGEVSKEIGTEYTDILEAHLKQCSFIVSYKGFEISDKVLFGYPVKLIYILHRYPQSAYGDRIVPLYAIKPGARSPFHFFIKSIIEDFIPKVK